MVGALLLQPDVARVVVGQLDDQRPLVLGQRRGNLLDQLLLPLDVDRRKQFVLVNGLEQLLVFVLARVLRVGERRDVAKSAVQVQLRGALVRKLEQLVRGGHLGILRR